MWRWVRWYFLLMSSLLHILDGNDVKFKRDEAVYVHGAGVQMKVLIHLTAILTTPTPQKKPSEIGAEELVSFIMSVDADPLLHIRLAALQKMSSVPLALASMLDCAKRVYNNVSVVFFFLGSNNKSRRGNRRVLSARQLNARAAHRHHHQMSLRPYCIWVELHVRS